jgi:hypothetical protein
MPENGTSGLPEHPIARFIDAARSFADGRDLWIARFGSDRGLSGEHRMALLSGRRRLEQLSEAARLRKSVGFYGESQCGKSNLVSRIGQGLGASMTATGSLLVRDPSSNGSVGPWAADGHPGAIEFARWLNPIAGTESTGVICRLTTTPAAGVPAGCFRARTLTQSDLIVSLALGNAGDTKYEGTRVGVHQEMTRLRKAETEPDPEGFVGQLLVAWAFLSEHWGGESSPEPRARDLIESGWREYLRELYLAARRPVWDPRASDRCPYLRFVGMLWSGQDELTGVFRRLLESRCALLGAGEVFIGATDVCRSEHPQHHSLLDVRNIDVDEWGASRSVAVRFPSAHGELMQAGIPRSHLSALIREIELPLLVGAEADAEAIDVLDYPGARPTFADGKIDKVQNPLQRALDVFRRGKLNYLFLAGIGLEDCSALCLVVTGNGPLNAGPVVRKAFHAWYSRETSDAEASREPGARFDHEPRPRRVDPPLVVAVSKSDMLLNEKGDVGSLFGTRLLELEKEYCCDLPWLQKWPGGPFRRVHWVHNPDAHGSVPLRSYLAPERASALARMRASYLSHQSVLSHVAEPGEAFDRLFRSPEDVDALFGSLAKAVDSVDREGRLVGQALAELAPIVAAANRDYLGPDASGRAEMARQEALLDVGALEVVLAGSRNPVAVFLRALQVSPIDVQRACRAAAADVGRIDPGEVGVLKFDTFYRKMSEGFVDRLESRLNSQHALATSLRQPQGSGAKRDALLSLKQHFAAMPGSDWFRNRVRTPVSAMFEALNPDALAASPVLAALVSTTWNRCIVWLDNPPPVVQQLPDAQPTRRPAHASSAKILSHWRHRLPDVYAGLVDPAGAARAGNGDLGMLRTRLRATVGELRGSLVRTVVVDQGADSLGSRLEQLEFLLRP